MDFSSMPMHALSGLTSYPFRFLDPALQRWLSRDPTGESGGVNLYGFAENDSVDWIDTDGLADWRLEGGHGGSHFQLGGQRWDGQTLQPIEHLGKTPPPLTAGQIEELRAAGLLDKAAKLFPEGTVARGALEAGLTPGKLLRLSRALGKPLCKTIARRALPPLMVLGAISDTRAIARTAATGAEAASAVGGQLRSDLETQSKVNSHLLGDDLSDQEITHWMRRRVGM